MIGLALIAMATVVATSLKESFRAELGSTLTADYLVTAPNQNTFSNRLADQIDGMPEFEEVSAVRYGNVRVDGSEHQMAATDLTLLKTKTALEHARKREKRLVTLQRSDVASASELQERRTEAQIAELQLRIVEFERAQALNQWNQARERLAKRTLRSPIAAWSAVRAAPMM